MKNNPLNCWETVKLNSPSGAKAETSIEMAYGVNLSANRQKSAISSEALFRERSTTISVKESRAKWLEVVGIRKDDDIVLTYVKA